MKVTMALQLIALLLFSAGTMSAEVDYRHPNLTIVVNGETLDSVLKAVGKKMRIFVATPTGFNPVVNCDIREQPVKLAFEKLLGDMSYSLQWKDDGERLAGLTILSGTGDAIAVTEVDNLSVDADVDQAGSMVTDNQDTAYTGMSADSRRALANRPAADYAVEVERQGPEAAVAVASELQDPEIELQRQEEVIAQESRMEEDKMRNQAKMAKYFEAYGIKPNP